jgi:uncharacterized tellurite resistance protein B-like protein
MVSTELRSHFLRLYQIAFADDNFDVLELKMLYKFAQERGLKKEDLDNILLNPSHETSIPENTEKRIEYLYDLAVMIWADKKVTEDEYNTLKKYCERFEFLEENITRLADYLLDCAKKEMTKEELLTSINN